MVRGPDGARIEDQAEQPERVLQTQLAPHSYALLHESVIRLGIQQPRELPHGLLPIQLGPDRGPHFGLPVSPRLRHGLETSPVERQSDPVAHLESTGPEGVNQRTVGVRVVDAGQHPGDPPADHEVGGFVTQDRAQVGHPRDAHVCEAPDDRSQPGVPRQQRRQIRHIRLRPPLGSPQGPVDQGVVA